MAQRLTDRAESTDAPVSADEVWIEKALGSYRISIANFFQKYLATDNTTSYTPTSDYHPATKKYVDDNAISVAFQTFALSDESSDLTVEQVLKWESVYDAGTVTDIQFSVNDAPIGDDIILDVKKNGVSVYTTKNQIDNGDTSSLNTATSPSLVAGQFEIEAGDVITFHVDQVGSSNAGAGLKGTLFFGLPAESKTE